MARTVLPPISFTPGACCSPRRGKGVSREDSYGSVQRNAMPVWRGKGDFLTLLEADKDVSKALSVKELEGLFDLAFRTKQVDVIFKRVFGAA